MKGRRTERKTGGIARRAFLLRNAVAVAGALLSPLFGGFLRRTWKDRPAGREGKYYRKLGEGE